MTATTTSRLRRGKPNALSAWLCGSVELQDAVAQSLGWLGGNMAFDRAGKRLPEERNGIRTWCQRFAREHLGVWVAKPRTGRVAGGLADMFPTDLVNQLSKSLASS